LSRSTISPFIVFPSFVISNALTDAPGGSGKT